MIRPPNIEDSDGKPDFTEGEPYEKDILKKVTIEQYEIAADRKKPFLKRVGNFLLGTSNAGRWAKVIKDFALFFVPYGKQIGDITDFVTDELQPQQTTNNMSWIAARLKERTTWQGIVTALTAVGASFSPEQAEAIITAGVGVVTLIWVFVKEPESEDAQ